MSELSIAHIAADREFAHANIYQSKSNGGYQWDFSQLAFFYTDRGYFIYRTSVDRFIPIRVIDNIVKIVGKKDLAEEILNFLMNIENCPAHIENFARKEMHKAISDDFLIGLPEKQVEFRKDKPDAIQLYYQNCIVKITAQKVTTHPYSDLSGFIWESQILPREYHQQEISITGNFARYINNISNSDQARVNSLCAAFGFYLHNFKDADYCPAIILNDEIISENPEGGTGKSLFFEAVSQFVNMETFDGELFSFEKGFLYQRIKPDTRLVFFDDTKKGFKFEKLKSFLTGGVTTERKGKDEIYISFEDSPKVGLATNFALNTAGNSLERRSLELEISQYYNKTRKPKQEFGRMMFRGWPNGDKEWIQFDNYAILCCQIFLTSGLLEQQLINLPEKKLLAQTNSDFLEFMEDFKFESEISKKQMLEDFKSHYPKYHKADWLTVNFFTKWIKAYCDYHKISIDTEKRDRSGAIRVYRFDNFPIIKTDF